MTWLIVVGSVVGYALIGGLWSIVLAAVWTAKSRHSIMLDWEVATASALWPFTIICAVVWVVIRPGVRVVRRAWKRAVLKLNPNYRGLT